MRSEGDKDLLVVGKGDRYVAGFLTFIAIPCLAYCWLMLNHEDASTLLGKAVKWSLLEFISIMIAFSVLVLIRAFARPRWLDRALATTGRRIMLFCAVTFVGAIFGLLIAFFFLLLGEPFH